MDELGDDEPQLQQVRQQVQREMRSLEPMVTQRRSRDVWPVHPGSALALDGEASAEFDPLPAQVRGLIHATVDNLHAVGALLLDARVLHTYAPYALCRAGIEASAVAWWLLTPQDRTERVLRSLRLLWTDAQDQARAVDGPSTEPLTEARKADIKRAAAASSIPDGSAFAPVHTTNVLRLMRDADLGFDPLITWRLCSGMTHARRWPLLVATDIEKVGPAATGGHEYRVTGSEKMLYYAFHTAMLTWQEAMRRFHHLRHERSAFGVQLSVDPN